MAKEPTKPPEGSTKPTPHVMTASPRLLMGPPYLPTSIPNWECTRKSGDAYFLRSFSSGRRLDGRPESTINVRIRVTDHRKCEKHEDCVQVTTEPVEPPADATHIDHPICAGCGCSKPVGEPCRRFDCDYDDGPKYSPPDDPEHWITGDGRYEGHTSDPDFTPPDRKAGPDGEVVFSKAVTCDEHSGCMIVTTERRDDIPAGSGGPFWNEPPPATPGKGSKTTHDPYAIIEDMEMTFRDLWNGMMDAVGRLRPWALRLVCRVISATVGVLVLSLLLIGCVGVLAAVYLFRALDHSENAYWDSQSADNQRKRL